MLTALMAAVGLLPAADPGEEDLPRRVGDVLPAAEAEVGDFLPQARRGGPKRPFFDFERSELGAFVGIAQFSSEFEADPGVAGGVFYRLPLPQLGRAGAWMEGLAAHIERDLNPAFYDPLEGSLLAFAAGVDYGVLDGENVFIRPQLGFAFVSYGDVEGTDDGLGLVAGAVFGAYWVKLRQKVSITYNPQWAYDGEDWILFHNLGINVAF